jgi:hypothetical protein
MVWFVEAVLFWDLKAKHVDVIAMINKPEVSNCVSFIMMIP